MEHKNSVILMNQDDRDKYTYALTKYYADKGKSTAEASEIIATIFAECQMGWKRCPKDLDTRIKIKSGFQWKSHENLKPRQKKVPSLSVEVVEENEDSSKNYIFKYLTNAEKECWIAREESYFKEFEFNNSSDRPLLMQLLFEEIFQRRIFIHQLQNKDADLSKQMTASVQRLTELQEKLGITREQRAGILDNIDGNIANIAVDLEEKLKHIEEVEKSYDVEELLYANLKAQRPPNNVLPPRDKIEAILKAGEGYVPGTDEEVIRIEEPEKLIETKEVDLPMGVVL